MSGLKRIILFSVALVLAGCATGEKLYESQFDPVSGLLEQYPKVKEQSRLDSAMAEECHVAHVMLASMTPEQDYSREIKYWTEMSATLEPDQAVRMRYREFAEARFGVMTMKENGTTGSGMQKFHLELAADLCKSIETGAAMPENLTAEAGK